MSTKTVPQTVAFAELPPNADTPTTNDRLRRVSQGATQAANQAAAATDAANAAAKAAAAALQPANNLSDVANAAAARTHLGAVSRVVIANPLGTANATYSQTQMNQVIALLGAIVTALDH